MAKKPRYGFLPQWSMAPPVPVAILIPLKKYCEQRVITRDQARTLCRKRWLYATKVRGRIYVYEKDPDIIEFWLSKKQNGLYRKHKK
jgi:hypothetical protein